MVEWWWMGGWGGGGLDLEFGGFLCSFAVGSSIDTWLFSE